MENNLNYKIYVLDEAGNWYLNAMIENNHDAIMIYKLYKKLGYSVKVYDNKNNDISDLCERAEIVNL